MSIQTKSKLKKWFKGFGYLMFFSLFLINMKIVTSDNKEFHKSDLSLLGLGVNLFESSYADEDACQPYTCVYTGAAPGYHDQKDPYCKLYAIGSVSCGYAFTDNVCGGSGDFCSYW